jgi:Cytochrome c554 and c-prime
MRFPVRLTAFLRSTSRSISFPRFSARSMRWLVFLCLSFGLAGTLLSQSRKTEISETTEDRIAAAAWWPTKNVADRAQLVGNAECAKCHTDKAATQATTPMAHAGARAGDAEILREHEKLSGALPPYRYEIARESAGSTYSVFDDKNSRGANAGEANSGSVNSDGANSGDANSEGVKKISAQLEWAFGIAHTGQTYIYSHDGVYYESRVSFYRTLDSLALTTGHVSEPPSSLSAALGRRMDSSETQHCFGCHTSGSMIAGRFDASHATPGVTCEQCHGAGAKHVAAMKAGKIEDGRRAILNPRRLGAVASVDFCGACHRTWADVLQIGVTGVANVRFQPYRLESSKCWGRGGDARLACYACHDPHQPLVTETASYDAKCLSCHVTKKQAAASTTDSLADKREKVASRGEKATASRDAKVADHPGAACPVATSNCASCHMPKVEVPSMHAPFTDHRIRIVRDAAVYPN